MIELPYKRQSKKKTNDYYDVNFQLKLDLVEKTEKK